ncbi:MAG: hypothetical protein JW910_22660 [Anaerolineae bacterium]|nr:hypothetical protein [Anaerolineae bacterium]
MAGKILVTYTTMSGSTTEVAEAIGKALAEGGATVDVKPMPAVTDLSAYDAFVLGGPMIVGWHRGAAQFVTLHQAALSQKPVAFFVTCLSLTDDGQETISGAPLYLDPTAATPPKVAGKLTFVEKMGTPANHLGGLLAKVPNVHPVSVGFFGGKLDYSVLNPLAWLFVRIIIRGKAGDYRNWDAINTWAASLPPLLSA